MSKMGMKPILGVVLPEARGAGYSVSKTTKGSDNTMTAKHVCGLTSFDLVW